MEAPLVWFAVCLPPRFDATLLLGQSRNRVKRRERARARAADPRRTLRRGEEKFFPLAVRKNVDALYNRGVLLDGGAKRGDTVARDG